MQDLGLFLLKELACFPDMSNVADEEESAVSINRLLKHTCSQMLLFFYYIYIKALNLIEQFSLQGQESNQDKIYLYERSCIYEKVS